MYITANPPQAVLQMSAKPRRRLSGLGGAAAPANLPPLVQTYAANHANNAAFVAFLEQALSSGYLPAVAPPNGNCAGAPASSAATKITSLVGAGVGTTGAVIAAESPALATGPVGLAIIGATALISALGSIFTHHSQAVQLQSNVLCENVPAANQALQALDQAGATAAQYQQLASQFSAALRSDPSYKNGDGLWGYDQCLQMLVAARAQSAASASSAAGASSAAVASGVPSWAIWALVAAGLWFLL